MVVILVSKDNHRLEFKVKEKNEEKARKKALEFIENSAYAMYNYKIIGFKH